MSDRPSNALHSPPRAALPALALAVLLGSCATPDAPPRHAFHRKPCAAAVDPGRALAQINALRAQARSCGDRLYPAVAPLRWSPSLEAAAAAHASDMASHRFMSHSGTDGSMPSQRAQRAGYDWGLSGENLGEGQSTLDEVARDWLASSGHCANIMDSRYRDYGMACASTGGGTQVTYWSQVFGMPRSAP